MIYSGREKFLYIRRKIINILNFTNFVKITR